MNRVWCRSFLTEVGFGVCFGPSWTGTNSPLRIVVNSYEGRYMDQVRGVDCGGQALRQLDEIIIHTQKNDIIVFKVLNIPLRWCTSMAGVSCSAQADHPRIENFQKKYKRW
jgi:hypothetical protein